MEGQDQYLPCLFQRLTSLTREQMQKMGMSAGVRIASHRRTQAPEQNDESQRLYPIGPLDSRQYLGAVRADLERLFNAVAGTPPGLDAKDFEDRPPESRPAFLEHPQLQSSVLNYGLAGFAGMISDRARDAALEGGIRWAIECFEPRISLTSVRASPDKSASSGRTVRIEIQGSLRGEAIPLHLISEFDCVSGRCAVREA